MDNSSAIVAVPGFGYYPEEFWAQFEGHPQSQGGNISDQLICGLLEEMWVSGLQTTLNTCKPFWDTVTCIPGTAAGETAELPCMKEYKGRFFNTSHNITRDCLYNGTWAGTTNYAACLDHVVPTPEADLCLEDALCQEDHGFYIYLLGYTVSMVALILAIIIFLYFKEMRCLRHKIHTNLFVSLLTSNLCWILIAVLQQLSVSNSVEVLSSAYCIAHVPLRYFHLSNFFWMFVEGLYLFLQVQASFSFGSIKLRHCLLLGWGFPLIITFIWTILVFCQSQIISVNPNQVETNKDDLDSSSLLLVNCPYTTADLRLELFAYNVPVFVLLACNTGFLVWIMAVVIAKLRMSQGAAASDHFHLRAAKALVVIVPLLGITYLIMIVGPRKPVSLFSQIYIYSRSILLSFQGFFITLPYCFLNSEVCSTVKLHWQRWQTTRHIGTAPQSARNSVVTAGFITVCDNISRTRAYTYQTVRSSIIDRRGTEERAKEVSLLNTGVPLDGPLVGKEPSPLLGRSRNIQQLVGAGAAAAPLLEKEVETSFLA